MKADNTTTITTPTPKTPFENIGRDIASRVKPMIDVRTHLNLLQVSKSMQKVFAMTDQEKSLLKVFQKNPGLFQMISSKKALTTETFDDIKMYIKAATGLSDIKKIAKIEKFVPFLGKACDKEKNRKDGILPAAEYLLFPKIMNINLESVNLIAKNTILSNSDLKDITILNLMNASKIQDMLRSYARKEPLSTLKIWNFKAKNLCIPRNFKAEEVKISCRTYLKSLALNTDHLKYLNITNTYVDGDKKNAPKAICNLLKTILTFPHLSILCLDSTTYGLIPVELRDSFIEEMRKTRPTFELSIR